MVGLCPSLQALKHYADVPGPYQQQAADLHKQLRWKTLSNLVQQYKATGWWKAFVRLPIIADSCWARGAAGESGKVLANIKHKNVLSAETPHI